MPLIKSGSKKAFVSNLKTEIHHGKPQKQALAIAYSNMRKYGHSMAKGGMCEACGGACKYAEHYDDGGKVDDFQKAGKAISSGVNPETAKSFHPFGPPQAEAEEVPHKAKGGMIKKYEYGKIKGVHEQTNTMHPGESGAGVITNAALWARGAEHEKPMRDEAIKLHSDKLKELKEMPNPKLKGMAHGGTLHNSAAKAFMTRGGHDAGSSEYALPHGLSEGGEVHESEDHELMEHCALELMEAIESKDKKQMLEALKAIILSLKE